MNAKLIENDFINSGKCVYMDDYGNKVQMFRRHSDDSHVKVFSAKIRFSNPAVTSDRIIVIVPDSTGDDGTDLHLKFNDGVAHDEDEDVKNGIAMLTEVIQHWISLMNTITILGAPIDWIVKSNPGMNKEEVSRGMMQLAAEYEELGDVVNSIMHM